MATVPTVPVTEIEAFGRAVFAAAGIADEEAATVTAHLLHASLRGVDSHGAVRFLVYARRIRAGGAVSPAPITTVSDAGPVAVLDGGGGLGQVVGQRAMDLAVERARSIGMGAVAVRASNHLGALAPYTMGAAEQGCVGIAMTNASPRMAPAGGAQALLGNNPWSIAVPGVEGPLVMDMANSVAALGKVRLLKARGEPLPAGWARDDDGLPTTDPQAAITGLLEPIAGYKGYVIALMIDVLTAALSGGGTSKDVGVLTDLPRAGDTSHLFLAMDVERFLPLADFTERVAAMLDTVRGSRLAAGSTEILAPGDVEARTAIRRRDEGIPLTAELADALRTAGDEFGVALPAWLAPVS